MSPEDTVRQYLAAMERRDLAAARSFLAPGFFRVFPGGKHFDAAGEAVYCFGTLHGERLDGTPYAGIRFVDRFTVHGGKLVDQQVWNDMGEALSGSGPGATSQSAERR